jgi:hypothetical protein
MQADPQSHGEDSHDSGFPHGSALAERDQEPRTNRRSLFAAGAEPGLSASKASSLIRRAMPPSKGDHARGPQDGYGSAGLAVIDKKIAGIAYVAAWRAAVKCAGTG